MRRLSTDRFDNRLAQIVCYVVAIGILILGILKLCRLGLDEAHLFFGLLLVLCLSVLCIIAGTITGPSEKPG
jgi:uncharacterized membrane protein